MSVEMELKKYIYHDYITYEHSLYSKVVAEEISSRYTQYEGSYGKYVNAHIDDLFFIILFPVTPVVDDRLTKVIGTKYRGYSLSLHAFEGVVLHGCYEKYGKGGYLGGQ